MPRHLRGSLALVGVIAGFAAFGPTALANPTASALEQRSDNAPGGAVTNVDDHRPAGAGQGRKVG